MNRVTACLFTCLMLAAGSTASAAAKPPRSVEIRYDMNKIGAPALEVWVDCKRSDDQLNECGGGTKKTGPEAYNFELCTSDRVVFMVSWTKADRVRAEITYAVTGTNLDDKDLAALRKRVSAGADTSTTAEVNARSTAATNNPKLVMNDIRPVTDDLIAGGKGQRDFQPERAHTADTKDPGERILDTAQPFMFRIESAHPRITVSVASR